MEDAHQFIGRVYKLTSSHTDKVYIGSTVQTLSNRLHGHKSQYKAFTKGVGHYRSSVEVLKHPDVKIELITEGEFTLMGELRKLEGTYIQDIDNCTNKAIPGRTLKQRRQVYYEKNKAQINQQKKEYYNNNKEKTLKALSTYRENNREQIRLKQVEQLTCEVCGCSYTRSNKLRHEKSNKHKNALEKPKEPEEEIEPTIQ